MNHNTLTNYYKTMWALAFHHKWDIESLENLMPFEIEIYANMITDYLNNQKPQSFNEDDEIINLNKKDIKQLQTQPLNEDAETIKMMKQKLLATKK